MNHRELLPVPSRRPRDAKAQVRQLPAARNLRTGATNLNYGRSRGRGPHSDSFPRLFTEHPVNYPRQVESTEPLPDNLETGQHGTNLYKLERTQLQGLLCTHVPVRASRTPEHAEDAEGADDADTRQHRAEAGELISLVQDVLQQAEVAEADSSANSASSA